MFGLYKLVLSNSKLIRIFIWEHYNTYFTNILKWYESQLYVYFKPNLPFI